MKLRNWLLLYFHGARAQWFFIRVAIYYGEMLLFLICSGIGEAQVLWFWVVQAVLLVGGLYLGLRRNCHRQREEQLSTEVICQQPDASRDTLLDAYDERRRRDLRFDALLFLALALESGLTTLTLYVAEAEPIFVQAGMLGLVPFLLLTSLVLLIRSRSAAFHDKTLTIDRYLADTEWQQIEAGQRKAHDRRKEGPFPMILTKVEPDRVEIDRLVQQYVTVSTRNDEDVRFLFAFILIFALLPAAGFLITLPLLHSSGSLLPLPFAGFGIFGPVSILFHKSESRIERQIDREKKLLRGQYVVRGDHILSIRRDPYKPYVTKMCLRHGGTVSVQGTPLQRMLLQKQPEQAQLLCCGKELLGIVFSARRASAEAAAEAEAEERAERADPRYALAPEVADYAYRLPLPIRDDTIYTEKQLQTEALRRLALMDFAKRKLVMDAVYREHELVKKRFKNQTRAEREELNVYQNAWMKKMKGLNPSLHDAEQSFMNKGMSREQIAAIQRNPHAKSFCILLGVIFAILMGGATIASLLTQGTSEDMSGMIIMSIVLAALPALFCLIELSSILKFNRLQKAYRQAQTWENIINAKVYTMLYKQAAEWIKQEEAAASGNQGTPDPHDGPVGGLAGTNEAPRE